MNRLAASLVFYRHPIHQETVDALVFLNQIGEPEVQNGIRRGIHRIWR